MPLDFRVSGSTLLQLSLSKNLRNFVNIASRYQSVHNAGISYRLEDNYSTNEAVAVIEVHPLSPPCRQILEHTLGAIAFMAYRYVKNFELKRVTLQHDLPENLADYVDFFRCPVEFNAPRNTMVFSQDLLSVDRGSLTTKLLSPILDAYFSREIKKGQLGTNSVTMMSYQVIPIILGLKSSEQKRVAEILNLHPKKYQRLLRDEGSTYAVILDDVRKNMAKRLLRDSDILIESIGGMLDYTAATSFARASTRWFGMSPRAYRKHLREDADRDRRGGKS